MFNANALKKISFAVSLAALPIIASAQWAVVDAGNIFQTTISAIESVAQTVKQLDQYKKQLQQLEDQIKNTKNPPQFLWDEANATIRKIKRTTNTLEKLKSQAGSIEDYLRSNYGTVDNYLAQKCFSSQKCTAEEWKALDARSAQSSTAQANATEAMLRGLDEQQNTLESDADNLAKIQKNAETPEGRLEAMGYANQFASAQANQLLQLRALLIAQQTAAGMRQRAQEDQEAQQRASSRQLREGSFQKSSGKTW